MESVYFAAPNLGRLRSRIENAPKTLTSDLRTKLQEIADMFTRLNKKFISKGIPCIIGEEETAGEENPAEETAGEEKPAEEAAEGDKASKKGKGKKEADAGDEFAD